MASAVVAAAAVALGGCGPSEPFEPMAVGPIGSTVEVHYTACKPARVKSVRLISLEFDKPVIDGSEPVLWRVRFANPVDLKRIEVGGAAPAGGVVDVVLAQPLDAATHYDVSLELDNGAEPHKDFQLDKMKDGRIAFENGYVTPDEFARRTACT